MSNLMKCKCGQRYKEPKIWPIKCRCGVVLNEGDVEVYKEKICTHRGPEVSKLNCNCQGNLSIYSCAIHEFCMTRKVKPGLPVFIIDGEVMKRDLQYCNFCDDNNCVFNTVT
jgi:hypothetical protein